MPPFLIKVMLYSVNAVLFEPNWNPTGMTEAMNIGHWGSPICYWELLEVLHRILQSTLTKHRDCFFLCLSFSEINLENTSVFYSFRQTLKHMALWVRPLLGTCAWHPRCSGDGRNGTSGGGSFPPKRTVKQILGTCMVPVPCSSSHHCSELQVPTTPPCLHTIHSTHFLYSILPT